MCRVSISLFIVFLLSLTYVSALFPTTNAIQIDLTGQVSSIYDGNTFTINQGGTIIRLADIDVPGVYQRGYDQAKSYLSDLISGKAVYLDQSALAGGIDGRLICVVYIDYDSQNYLNVNKKVLESPYFTQVDNRNDFNPSTWTLLVPKDSASPPVLYTLTIQPPDGSGTTNPAPGGYTYDQGSSAQVTATSSSGWEFSHWILDGENSVSINPIPVTMNSARTVKAVFIQNAYTLIIQPPDGSGTTDPSSGSYRYYQVVTVPVQATPSSGWVFDHWLLDGSNIGSQNPYTVNMNDNHQLKAVFTQGQPTTPQPPSSKYELSVLRPIGSGSTDPVSGTYIYNQVVSVDMRAIPSSGWRFDHWILDGVDTVEANPTEVRMDSNHMIQAVFTSAPSSAYTLTVETPDGSGSTDPSSGSYTYQQPVRTTIKAAAASGWVFDHWVLDGANAGKSNPYEVIMNADHRIKAVFAASSSSSNGIPCYPLESVLLGVIASFVLITSLTRVQSRKRVIGLDQEKSTMQVRFNLTRVHSACATASIIHEVNALLVMLNLLRLQRVD
jgi:Divergent InlB B-repeat domain